MYPMRSCSQDRDVVMSGRRCVLSGDGRKLGFARTEAHDHGQLMGYPEGLIRDWFCKIFDNVKVRSCCRHKQSPLHP